MWFKHSYQKENGLVYVRNIHEGSYTRNKGIKARRSFYTLLKRSISVKKKTRSQWILYLTLAPINILLVCLETYRVGDLETSFCNSYLICSSHITMTLYGNTAMYSILTTMHFYTFIGTYPTPFIYTCKYTTISFRNLPYLIFTKIDTGMKRVSHVLKTI